MGTILLTGNVKLLNIEDLETAATDYRIIVAGEVSYSGKKQNIRVYHTAPCEEKFGQLFDVYSFDAVWYVSGFADGGEGAFGEMQLMEKTVLECRRSKVEKLIILSTDESQNYLSFQGKNGEEVRREYPFSRAFMAAQSEALGTFFAEKTEQKVIVLWLPYLAGRVNEKNFLGSVFRKIYNKEKIFFPYHREDAVDFLSCRDLLNLLCQITEEPDDESGAYFVKSGNSYTYGDLEDVLKMISPETMVIYENYPDVVESPRYSVELRKKYGFIPMDNVFLDMGSYYRIFVREIMNSPRGLLSGLVKHTIKKGSVLFRLFEILLAFVLTELIASFSSDYVYFQFVDVRLLFIVLMATMYGMRYGIFSAVLECVVLIRQYSLIGVTGVQLFYNIENWVPFAVYLMAGSVAGYIKNKNTEEIEFSQKEYNLLRNKYIFLNDVYHGAIQNKGEYKRQVLGFKDSFGKIFSAVQKLDSELPEKIFLEGLGVLEDILENQSIALYSLDAWQKFGRLMVCSSRQLSKLKKSIQISDYQEVYDTVNKGDIWKNTALIDGFPMYASGVFRDGKIVLLITVWEAGIGQYGMDYINIFRILCGLVQSSFLKALRYEELRQSEIYYPGTEVVYPRHMRQLVDVQEDMRVAGVADYVLLRLEQRDKVDVCHRLTGLIRATDTLGAAEDGTLYLLLVQTNRENFCYVQSRLDKSGLNYQIVERMS